MSLNYTLPGEPGDTPSGQGAWDSDFITYPNGPNGYPRLMRPMEELKVRIRRGDYNEGFDSLLSDTYLLPGLCRDLQKTLAEIPESDPSYRGTLMVLGRVLYSQAEMNGDIEDLELSLQYLEQALNLTPAGHGGGATCLINLATAFGLRSQHTHQVADADKALHYGQQAINAVTDGESPRHFLVALGTILRHRYRITYQIADLQHGIRYLKAALETPQQNRGKHVDILNNLSNLYHELFKRTEGEADLDLAIEYGQAAVQISTDDSHERAVILLNYALCLLSRFKMSLRVADIDMAIQNAQQALMSLSSAHAYYLVCLGGLGIMFKHRYFINHKSQDLDEAIRHEAAIERWTLNEDSRFSRYYNRGVSFAAKYEITRKREDFLKSFRAFYEGFSSETQIFDRLRCGYNTCLFATRVPFHGLNLAVEIVEEMLEIVPFFFQPTGSRNDIQAILNQLSGMASSFASVLFAANKPPVEVLQKLEDSRGIVISSVIDVRSDGIELREKHPALWMRFTHCRASLGAMNSKALKMDTERTYSTDVKRLEQLHKDWSDIKEEIRRNPGFERFLLSPTERELCELARIGPIVTLNTSHINSAAFLVTTSGIQSLSLPNLKLSEALHWVKIFAPYGNPHRRDAELCEDEEEEQLGSQRTPSEMHTGLLYLWTVAVKPVLQQLNLLNRVTTPTRLPQICWVGGGIMGLLPLHAAGDHASGSTENAISHVISSYAATFKSLQFVQNRPRISVSRSKQLLLLAAMPTTPGGHKPLQVQEEITAIEDSASKWALSTTFLRPSKANILDALKTCTIAHFACHGTADRVEPAKSGLLLGKETVEKLTIEDLDTISCHNAQIVYLSACSTAEVGKMNLADESVHLASSFQLSGFQHVIGTLWGVDDNAAVEIAKRFYENLPGSGEDSYVSPAKALHDAVVSFRNTEDNWKDCSKWASFIHLGC